MKKEIVLSLLFLIGANTAYSQRNVGINTNTPRQTLDVNGTVRLKTPGEYSDNSQLLGISRSTGEVVAINPEQGESFEIKTITFSHSPKRSDSEVGLRNINIVDLGYPVNKYEVAVLSARLTKHNGEAPMMKFYSVQGDRRYGPNGGGQIRNDKYENRITGVGLIYRGFGGGISGRNSSVLNSENNNGLLQGNLDIETAQAPQSGDERFNMVFYGVPKYQVIKKNGNWHFKGGFDYEYPLQSNLKWTLEVMVINKNWVERKKTVKVEVDPETHTKLTKVRGSGAHPVVR